MAVFQTRYRMFLPDASKATQCIECGKCESHCPQNIAIREELKKRGTCFRIKAQNIYMKENIFENQNRTKAFVRFFVCSDAGQQVILPLEVNDALTLLSQTTQVVLMVSTRN